MYCFLYFLNFLYKNTKKITIIILITIFILYFYKHTNDPFKYAYLCVNIYNTQNLFKIPYNCAYDYKFDTTNFLDLQNSSNTLLHSLFL